MHKWSIWFAPTRSFLCKGQNELKLFEQLCSAPSCSWTELHAYYFQPNYYLTFLSPSDPAPPLFLWGAALPEAHPRTPPCPPVCQQHHPLPPFTKTLKLQNEVISKRLGACDLMHSRGAVRSSEQDRVRELGLFDPGQALTKGKGDYNSPLDIHWVLFQKPPLYLSNSLLGSIYWEHTHTNMQWIHKSVNPAQISTQSNRCSPELCLREISSFVEASD